MSFFSKIAENKAVVATTVALLALASFIKW
jgi:hypothetical protein